MARIVLLTSNASKVDGMNTETGNWLEELAAPYFAFKDAGHHVEIVSTNGGRIPFDPKSLSEDFLLEAAKRFYTDKQAMAETDTTKSLSEVSARHVDCVLLVGGHGGYADYVGNPKFTSFVERVDRDGGIVAAVCHGPIGLVDCKGADGKPLVAGRKVTGFTDEEEKEVGLDSSVPFLLESKLRELGAEFENQSNWAAHCVADGRLVTGQNNFSAGAVADKVLELLEARRRVLLLVTSESEVPGFNRPTGSWLEEVAAPYYTFVEAGFQVDIVSTKGGAAPIDAASRADDFYWDAGKRFDRDPTAAGKMNATIPLDDVVVDDKIKAIFLVGGHGGYADQFKFKDLIESVDRNGGIVAAVCHGPIGLCAATKEDGSPFVAGRKMTGFTNEEEEAVGADKSVPFLLEKKLQELGAKYEKKDAFKDFCIADGRLVTGQNNCSATVAAKKVLELLNAAEK